MLLQKFDRMIYPFFRQIPLPSYTIKLNTQNNGKTTPTPVKIRVSICHCILLRNRIKIAITNVSPKIKEPLTKCNKKSDFLDWTFFVSQSAIFSSNMTAFR